MLPCSPIPQISSLPVASSTTSHGNPPRRFPHTLAFTAYDDPECKLVYDLDELYGGVA
jgi:hypothetical protein